MSIEERKVDHLRLCAEDEVEYRSKTTLLDDLELIHDSLPELDVDAIDLQLEFVGRKLAAPFLITGMTGGATEAEKVNKRLAAVAQRYGLAFGVGSQRAMLKDRNLVATYQVRDVAPDVALLGNIGAVQLAAMTISEVEDLVGAIDADALCVHLNPGQELIQPEGDRDFRGCLAAIGRTSDALSKPVMVKETGCGMSPRTVGRLKAAGVEWVDVAGAGGTTWIGVETHRASAVPHKQAVGDSFWDWGIPTAASIAYAHRAGLNVVGSGGMRTPLDAAKAFALGANVVGMALPWLKAAMESETAAAEFAGVLIDGLRVACAITGSATVQELASAPRVVGPRLSRWLDVTNSL